MAPAGSTLTATAKAPTRPVSCRKRRRSIFSKLLTRRAVALPGRVRPGSSCFRYPSMASHSPDDLPHRGVDALVAAAAADVAGHGLGDLLLVGGRVGGDQGGRLHDLAGLAEAALRNVECPPGPL